MFKVGSLRFVIVGVLAGMLVASYVAPSQGKVSIKFVGMEYYEWTGDWYRDVVAKFEKQNPDINVKVEVVPWDYAFDRYITWIKGGKAPDVGGGGAKWLADFKRMNALEPLNQYMSPAFKENIIPSLLEPLEKEGKYYALPFAAAPRGVFWNVRAFKEVGIDKFPENWDEFVVACEKIKAGTDMYPYAIDLNDHEAIWHIRPFLLSAGGGLVTNDRWTLNTPENLEAVQFITDLVRKYKFTQPGPTGSTRQVVQRLFIGEHVAMLHETMETIGRLAEFNPEMKYHISPFPQHRAPGVISLIDTIYLFKGAHPEAGWKFIEFLMSDPIHLDWVKRLSCMGGTKSVLKIWPTGPHYRELAQLLPIAKMYPVKAGWDVVEEEMRAAVQLSVLGTKTPAQALKEAQERVEKRLGL